MTDQNVNIIKTLKQHLVRELAESMMYLLGGGRDELKKKIEQINPSDLETMEKNKAEDFLKQIKTATQHEVKINVVKELMEVLKNIEKNESKKESQKRTFKMPMDIKLNPTLKG